MARFPYTVNDASPGIPMPRLPFLLHHGGESLLVAGLVDSGASVNVMPYHVGLALGIAWEDHDIPVKLAGNLGAHEARAIRLAATFHHIPNLVSSVPLLFAWSRSDDAPLLLGQTDFFEQFDVCYYTSRRIFDVNPAETA